MSAKCWCPITVMAQLAAAPTMDLVLKTFASLLETHRYYGSVAATSRETLRLQETLPTLFIDNKSDTPCCSVPSFALPDSSNDESSPVDVSAAKQALGKPSLFHQTSLTNLPLHLLEGCNRVFHSMWTHKLQQAASKPGGANFIDYFPQHPAAVVTQIRSLDAIPTSAPPSQSSEGKPPGGGLPQRYSLVLPIILALVMDWKLQDESTTTIRMEFPGVISGNLVTQQYPQIGSSPLSIEYVELELDYDAMLKSMGDAMEPLVRTVVTKGWLASVAAARNNDQQQQQHKQQHLASSNSVAQTSEQSSSSGEEEEEYIDPEANADSAETPLQALFAAAEAEHKAMAQHTPLQALFAKSRQTLENDPLNPPPPPTAVKEESKPRVSPSDEDPSPRTKRKKTADV